MKEHFKTIGKEIFELKPEIELDLNEEQNTIIEENEIKIYKNLIKYKTFLKYNEEINIKLKQFIKDDFGLISFFKNGFIPEYECYCTNKELVIKIDCTEDSKIKAQKIEYKGEYQSIEIIGERKRNQIKEKDINYIINRESGKYHFLIPFIKPRTALGELIKEDIFNGIKTFIFSIKDINYNE